MTFTALSRYITPPWRTLLLVVLLLFAGSGLTLAQPWLAGQLTGAIIDPATIRLTLGQVLLAWLILLLLRGAVEFASRYCIGVTGEEMAARLRSRLYDHLQALPLSYHYRSRRGDILAILSNDAETVSGFVTSTLVQLLPLVLTFLGALVLMALIDPLIAGAALLLVPAYFLATKLIGRGIRPVSRAWIDAYSSLFAFLEENLGMLPAIKSFTREREESKRFAHHNANLLSLSRRQLFIESVLGPSVALIAGIGLLLLLWLGSVRVSTGGMNPGELVSLLLYAMLLSQPMRGLADLYGQIQRTRGAAERILAFLEEQPEPEDAGKPAMPAIEGDIRFDAVQFSYPGGKPVLKGLDLHIAAGETVAITGPNGAGKSTIAHLLMRLSDPDAGRILIDGIDIAGVSLVSLRGQIGLVAQHTLLLNTTVAQNIGYGRALVERAEIERAARAAHAHEFICQLPKGYDTLIGEQGLQLSGGQRQRISLARTLLVNPPVLILDEATSMFDPAGEEGFIAECREVLGGKTVILITHRPASLRLATRVLHLPELSSGLCSEQLQSSA